ncbi:hypothetical protein CPB86DRAFT_801398 [Serendipita vermifera]|nr:hypothetical protein CPB86DRAFT_801398 [Serendipita vermifera]
MSFLIRRATTSSSTTEDNSRPLKRGRIVIRKVDISQPTLIPWRTSFSLPETRPVPLRESMMRKDLQERTVGHKRNASEPIPTVQPTAGTSSRPTFMERLRWGKPPSNNASASPLHVPSTESNRIGLNRPVSSIRFSLTTSPGALSDLKFANPRESRNDSLLDMFPMYFVRDDDFRKDDDVSTYSHASDSTYYHKSLPPPSLPPEYQAQIYPESVSEMEPALDDISEVRPLSVIMITKEMATALIGRAPEENEIVHGEVMIELEEEDVGNRSITSDEKYSVRQFFLENYGVDLFPPPRFPEDVSSITETVSFNSTMGLDLPSNRVSIETWVEGSSILSRSAPEIDSNESVEYGDTVRRTGAGPRRPSLESRRLTMDEFQQQMLRNSRRSGRYLDDISDPEDLKAKAEEYVEDPFPMDEDVEV